MPRLSVPRATIGTPRAPARPARSLTRLCAAILCWTLAAHVGAPSALAFQADPVEQDVQEYTRMAMRHDSLLLNLNLKRISDAEQAEMPQLGAQCDAIKAKYAPGGPLYGQAAQFNKRQKEPGA